MLHEDIGFLTINHYHPSSSSSCSSSSFWTIFSWVRTLFSCSLSLLVCNHHFQYHQLESTRDRRDELLFQLLLCLRRSDILSPGYHHSFKKNHHSYRQEYDEGLQWQDWRKSGKVETETVYISEIFLRCNPYNRKYIKLTYELY